MSGDWTNCDWNLVPDWTGWGHTTRAQSLPHHESTRGGVFTEGSFGGCLQPSHSRREKLTSKVQVWAQVRTDRHAQAILDPSFFSGMTDVRPAVFGPYPHYKASVGLKLRAFSAQASCQPLGFTEWLKEIMVDATTWVPTECQVLARFFILIFLFDLCKCTEWNNDPQDGQVLTFEASEYVVWQKEFCWCDSVKHLRWRDFPGLCWWSSAISRTLIRKTRVKLETMEGKKQRPEKRWAAMLLAMKTEKGHEVQAAYRNYRRKGTNFPLEHAEGTGPLSNLILAQWDLFWNSAL